MSARRFIRRARPALGTLVEMGLAVPDGMEAGSAMRWAEPALRVGWQAIAEVERAMSAFDPASDIGRFNRARPGAAVPVSRETSVVLRAARSLWRASGGLFDVSCGTGAQAWSLSGRGGAARLHKRSDEVHLDLGGIAKGHAVDRAFEALAGRLGDGPAVAWWVNAGGDLRVRGIDLPVHLRDERAGGARPWLRLRDGALATSHYGPSARARLGGAGPGLERHVSVVAPRCLWSDALTKVVALSGRLDHPLLARHGAVAWLHRDGGP